MSNDTIRFMTRAIELAQLGKNNGGGSFGAVIVRNGAVVAEGFNKVKTLSDCTQHAELLVIQEACRKLKTTTLTDCTLYTSCEPCMMCLGAIYWAKIHKVYYGSSAQDAKDHGFIYSNMFYATSKGARHKEFNLEQLMAEEAIKVWK